MPLLFVAMNIEGIFIAQVHRDISLVILFVQSLGNFWQNWATLVWTVHFSNDTEANVIFGSVFKPVVHSRGTKIAANKLLKASSYLLSPIFEVGSCTASLTEVDKAAAVSVRRSYMTRNAESR